MFADLLENGSSIRKVADMLTSFKKHIPMPRVETPDTQLQKELERLALSAPHMLADMGFERDAKACSSEKVVWRRGTHSVIIFNTTRTAAVFV